MRNDIGTSTRRVTGAGKAFGVMLAMAGAIGVVFARTPSTQAAVARADAAQAAAAQAGTGQAVSRQAVSRQAPSGQALSGQNWPQWRGPQRDGRSTATIPAKLAATPSPVWKVTVGIGHASPVIADGRIFVFARQNEKETLYALDVASGKTIWTEGYVAPYELNSAAASHGKGPKSTPVVAGTSVCTLGISGVLSCHDTATGRVKWRKSFEKEFKHTSPEYGVAMSPIADGNLLFVHVGGQEQGALRAFDLATGAIKWSWTEDGPAYASPVVFTVANVRQLITLTQRTIVGIDVASGKTLWRLPFTTNYDQNSVTPLIYKDTIVFSGLDQETFAVRPSNQGGTWTAERVWANRAQPMYMSSPVLSGDTLYGLTHRNRGQFFAMDVRTGQTLWVSPPRQGENAAIVVAGNRVLALTDGAELIVLDAAQSTFSPVARVEVATSPTWAHPVVLGDRVLIKDEQTLALLKIG